MNVYLDVNTRRPTKGLAVKFPYHPDAVKYIKNVLGLEWDKTQKAWVSEGPEVLLDMNRFGIKITDMSPGARRISEAFRKELWDIMDVRAEDSEEAYAYQKQGTEILCRSPFFLLGDDMGLGKTKQVLDAIAKTDAYDVLVVAPKTLTYNWLDEVQKWHPEISAGVVPDNAKTAKRGKTVNQIGRVDFWQDPPRIVIANYEKTRLDDWPMSRRWGLVVADEATKLKNSTSQIWKRLNMIKKQADRFWPLTGTPLEIKLIELYNIMRIMRPSVLGNYMRFKDQHLIEDWSHNIVGAKNIDLLRERIGPFMLRRTKSEVLKQLPPKIFTPIFVKMTPAEQREYQHLVMEFDDWVFEKNDGSSASPMTKTIRMRQFCCSPLLVDPEADDEDDIRLGKAVAKRITGLAPVVYVPAHLGKGSKYESLLELLEDHSGKTIIFCFFEKMVSLLADWLKKDIGYNTEAYISGAISSEERIRRVKEFNEGRLGDVFISTDAGQQGINLTSADLVIHYDQLWNPQQMHQREDRAHRIGQKSSVTVVDLLVMDTIDVGMYELNREREKLFEEVIEGAEEAMTRKLSPARLRRIVEGKLTNRRNEE